MADRKRQHYVPRFLLRNFAADRSGKTICILNIQTGKSIPGAKLKTQACKDYFYGSDGYLENALSVVEGRVSAIIADVCELKLPCWRSNEHDELLLFTVQLYLCTQYAAEATSEFMEGFMKSVVPPHLKEHAARVGIRLDQPAAFNLKFAWPAFLVASDLGYALFHNKTGTPFITSDNPVVLYNQFLERRKLFGSNTGWVTKGLQVFLPLSPTHLLLFYDRDVYGTRNKSNWVIDGVTPADVCELNKLQCITANENVYYGANVDDAYVRGVLADVALRRRVCRASATTYQSANCSDKPLSALIHLSKPDIACGLKLSSVYVRNSAKRYKLGDKVLHVRNRRLYDIMRAECGMQDAYDAVPEYAAGQTYFLN